MLIAPKVGIRSDVILSVAKNLGEVVNLLPAQILRRPSPEGLLRMTAGTAGHPHSEEPRGCSLVGRARRSHRRGRGFESPQLQFYFCTTSISLLFQQSLQLIPYSKSRDRIV